MASVDPGIRTAAGTGGAPAEAPAAFAPVRGEWYVAALAEEVTRTPLRRTVCGDAVALYRTERGTVAALADACPHRAYPLSAGRVCGDALVCGYHGFTFEPDGRCIAVPGQAAVPDAARARAYAVVERGPLVWLYDGPATDADEARIPDAPWASGPRWTSFASSRTIGARYGLVIDNLLDLSHETYVHEGTIGSPEVAATPIAASLDGDVVRVSRRMHAVACPPFYRESTGMETPIDRWQDIEFRAPGFYVLHVRVAPHEAGDDRAAFLKIVYCVTPAAPRETALHWLVCRSFAREDDAVTRTLARIQETIVAQDRDALERLERSLPERGGWREVSVASDRGGLLARKQLRTLLDRSNA